MFGSETTIIMLYISRMIGNVYQYWMEKKNIFIIFIFIFRKTGAGPALPSEDPPSASPGNAHSQVLLGGEA
jgi:hypothetical protein